MKNKTTFKVISLHSVMFKGIFEYSLIVETETGERIYFKDPEEANEFLKLYFKYTNDDIKKYWEI
jgi:hypothetical protein